MDIGIRDIYNDDREDPALTEEEDDDLEQAIGKKKRGKKSSWESKRRNSKDPRPADVAAESDY